jgi:hypothetical protein
MKTNNSEYELVGEQGNKLIVRVKHMGNQTVVVTKAEGNSHLSTSTISNTIPIHPKRTPPG